MDATVENQICSIHKNHCSSPPRDSLRNLPFKISPFVFIYSSASKVTETSAMACMQTTSCSWIFVNTHVIHQKTTIVINPHSLFCTNKNVNKSRLTLTPSAEQQQSALVVVVVLKLVSEIPRQNSTDLHTNQATWRNKQKNLLTTYCIHFPYHSHSSLILISQNAYKSGLITWKFIEGDDMRNFNSWPPQVAQRAWMR